MLRRSRTASAPSSVDSDRLPLGEPLLTREEMRAADTFAVESLHLPALSLMEQAASAAVARLIARFDSSITRLRGLVVAGTGNNGGDALALARILVASGFPAPRVCLVGDRAKLGSVAKAQLLPLEALGVAVEPLPESLAEFPWIADGIFGTGLDRPVAGGAKQAIEAIRRVAGRTWVLSLDVPSGLCADTGRPLGAAVVASETVTFGFWKRGLATGDGPDHAGQVTLAPISLPRMTGEKAGAFLFDAREARSLIPSRRRASHKGDFGHAYVWSGEPAKEGASGLALLAALRCGAGLATLCSSGKLGSLRERLAIEIMTEENLPLDWIPDRAGAVMAIGPGLGTSAAAGKRLESALASHVPLVLDADALNCIAESEALGSLLAKRVASTVVTPHPKEAARLLGTETMLVEADRYRATRALSAKFRCVALLKGNGTLVTWPDGPIVCVARGNSGLAKGGSGDVLTGIIASLLAQGLAAPQAALLAAFLHGRAAEILSQRQGSERIALASEIASTLPLAVSELEP